MSSQEPHHLYPLIDTFHLSQVHSHKCLACKHEGDAPCSKFFHSLPDEILPLLSFPRLLTNSSVWLTQSYFLSLPFESGSCILGYLRELVHAFSTIGGYDLHIWEFLSVSPQLMIPGFPWLMCTIYTSCPAHLRDASPISSSNSFLHRGEYFPAYCPLNV